MSYYKTRSDYFEQLCRITKLFAHQKPDPVSGDIRKTFFRLNDAEEALAGQVEGMHFPCLVHTQYAAKPINKNDDERLQLLNEFWILVKAADGSSDAIQDAYTQAEDALQQLIGYMLNEYDEKGSCGPFRQIEISMFSWDAIGPEMEGLYGFSLAMREEQRATDITNYNPAYYFKPANL